MKNLVLGMSVALVASQAAGCVISSDSSAVGHIAASWHMQHVNADGTLTAAACPVGYDTAALHTVAASPDGTALDACTSINSDCYIDLFNCNDFSGLSSALPAQNYLTWIEITTHDGSQTWATSTAEFVDITNVDRPFDTEILEDGGYFKLSWSLMGESSGAALTCSQTAASSAAGGSVEVVSTLVGSSLALTDKFNCEDHFGYSAPLPWGSYQVVMDALNSSNQALGSMSTDLGTQLIGSTPNSIKDLGHAVLKIAGQ